MKKLVLTAMAITCVGSAFGQMKMRGDMNEFGGPIYSGVPALSVTAALVKAGGGPSNFSIATALNSMVGPKMTKAELTKLTNQYGKKRVGRFVMVFDYAVADSLKMATAAGVTLPQPTIWGKELAATLVKAGMDSRGTFWTGFLLDKAVTHHIHMAVMDDIDRKWSKDADRDYHRISNQAHYDLGKAFGIAHVKLAPLH